MSGLSAWCAADGADSSAGSLAALLPTAEASKAIASPKTKNMYRRAIMPFFFD